ncbi:MAG: glycosyl hydrolase 115 family protein [Deltaproteobacteria bacterium]|nr:glycosyl hydrolase 115 family protein [Deltaproteobacteria bacterium]
MNSFHCKLTVVICALFMLHNDPVPALPNQSYVLSIPETGSFPLTKNNASADIYIDANDHKGLFRAAQDLKKDIQTVTGIAPNIVHSTDALGPRAVFLGTIGKSPLIDDLILSGKLDADEINGQWESYTIQVINDPIPNVKTGLVIAGSDKRGSIYGCYDLSEQIGVSPWYWWADVPVKKKNALYIKNKKIVNGPPKVKYRGIFLNDEEPDPGRWAVEKYGGFTHQFYENVFELILRLKGNFLWPAMWWASFNSDDPLNPQLADEYGIVIGTTHHEPMMRAHAEWKQVNGGEWNYETNEEKLKEFWTSGIERMGSYESIVTLAMRGDGDMAMSRDTNIRLLEKIVGDQRKILENVTGKDIKAIPQVWALYKEVQDYHDKGMVVPDDVTLLLCDDNWGNVRRLPEPGTPPRSGGYGMYYHFDFVGGPRNYKWVNTVSIPRIWEQMNLTYRHGVDRIWIVNAGDLKPMEYPISFFMDYAWDPDKWTPDHLPEYARLWAEQQFGPEHSEEIAAILTGYTQYNSRRKPEMLGPDVYSLFHYREAENIVNDYKLLVERAEAVKLKIPPEYKDSYYELVLHPVIACANLNDLHVTVARNRLYAGQGRAATNDLALKAESLFRRDAEISRYYNKVLADGKWNHMMDQTHISYTYWQQPEKDVMPGVAMIELPEKPDMGVSVEGSEGWWPGDKSKAVLPDFDNFNRQTYFIELFNRGQAPFEFNIKTNKPWINVDPVRGKIEKEERVNVSINWDKAPEGIHNETITVTGPFGKRVDIELTVKKYDLPTVDSINGFIEGNGYVSIEAEHYNAAIEKDGIRWLKVPGMGRTLSGMITAPVDSRIINPGQATPRLEYNVYFISSGDIKVHTYLSPSRNIYNTKGLHYGISFDDEIPQIINMHENDTVPDWKYPPVWSEAVANNIMIQVSKHHIAEPGWHMLRYWMVDPAVVLQKLVVDTGGLKASYLGPPESFYKIIKR